jgi:hypothetical protein
MGYQPTLKMGFCTSVRRVKGIVLNLVLDNGTKFQPPLHQLVEVRSWDCAKPCSTKLQFNCCAGQREISWLLQGVRLMLLLVLKYTT